MLCVPREEQSEQSEESEQDQAGIVQNTCAWRKAHNQLGQEYGCSRGNAPPPGRMGYEHAVSHYANEVKTLQAHMRAGKFRGGAEGRQDETSVREIERRRSSPKAQK